MDRASGAGSLAPEARSAFREARAAEEWEKRSSRSAYQYDWNMLPIGQALWLKELETYIDFPPLQNPASYNLQQVMQQVREMKSNGLSD